MDDYYTSLELAEAISKCLKIDLIVCENNYYLKTIMTKNHYRFKKEIISEKQVNSEEQDRRLLLNIVLYSILLIFIVAYKVWGSSGS